MSGKRPSLADSMKRAAQPEPAVLPPTPKPASMPAEAPISAAVFAPPTAKPAGFYAATRAGKKKVTAAVDPPVHKQLKGLAVAQDTTTEALLLEAIGDLLTKYGQNRSA